MSQIDLLQWIQGFATSWLDAIMIAFSFIGDEEFYVATVPLIYFAVHKKVGIRLSVVLALSMFCNEALKVFFGTARPIGLEGIRNLYVESAPGNSFPSGHAQGSATYWGYLATQVRKKWFFALSGVMVLAIMLSRLYLGVHWPIDVVGGLIFGLLFVAAIIWVDSYITKRPLVFWLKLLLGIVLPALLLMIYNEEDGRKLAGFLIGAWVGYVIESETIGFELPKSLLKRILPAVVGILVVFALRSVLKSVLPAGAPWGDVLRYAVIGLAAFWAMPWAFVKLKWYPSKVSR